MPKRPLIAAALTLAVMSLIGLAIVWEFGAMMVAPTPSMVAAATPPARDIRLRARDGIALAATYWPGKSSAAPGVLLLHGNGASRAAMSKIAAWLNGLGYAALTLDFRGHGESARAPHSFRLFESRDAEAAFVWLKHQQRGARIGVIGTSLGGAASLLGDHGPLPADAMVLQAVYPTISAATRNRMATLIPGFAAALAEPLLSYQSWPRFGVWPDRLSPIEAVRLYKGPVLVIGGGADRYTPPDETGAIYRAAPNGKQMWIVDGLDHAQVSGLDDEAYRACLRRYFAQTIGLP